MQQNIIITKKAGLFAMAGLTLCAVGGSFFKDDISNKFKDLKSDYQQKLTDLNNATRPEAVLHALGY